MARKVIIYVLVVFFAVISFQVKTNAEAVSSLTIKQLIVKHAIDLGLDPALALSIAKAESGFCHEKRSRYGAVGVFQLLPSTARKMGFDPYKLQDNIKGGITYYKKMYKLFGTTELALAAYNAGPGNVKKYNGVPPFVETKKFVSSIMRNYSNLKVNPDPAMSNYKDAEKMINNLDKDAEKQAEEDFRMQQEAILKTFLANQGV